jgi:hypothetical protein
MPLMYQIFVHKHIFRPQCLKHTEVKHRTVQEIAGDNSLLAITFHFDQFVQIAPTDVKLYQIIANRFRRVRKLPTFSTLPHIRHLHTHTCTISTIILLFSVLVY